VRPLATVLLALAATACAGGPPPPATLDTAHESCRFCRMVVSDQRFAAQIVALREEPLFFDDLGCLQRYARGLSTLPAGAFVYVADHRTGEWVPGGRAVYTRVPGLATPMDGGMVAHRDTSSRDADRLVPSGGTPVSPSAVIGTAAGEASR